MKATIVEIRGQRAVVLKEDGSFEKMKACNHSIGEVVTMKEKRNSGMGRFASMAAAALFAVLLGGGAYTYGLADYYVSVDVNPGIMLEVNRFDRVIGVEAVNEDGAEVLNELDIENRNITEVVTLTVDRIAELGYFEEEGGEILISALAKENEDAEETAEELEEAVQEEIEEDQLNTEVTSKVVGYEMVQAAREIEGMTPGKYNIIVNLLGIAPEHASEYADTSIKEIMKEVKAAREAEESEMEVEEEAVDQTDLVEEPSEDQEETPAKQQEKKLEKEERKTQKESEKALEKQLKEAEKATRKEASEKEREDRKNPADEKDKDTPEESERKSNGKVPGGLEKEENNGR
ncbi:hypothetical protein J3A84_13600 [Proteiniclasticum sp. SCR006]|uniref:RsgI N-terminal anti-sigma domain-containing protein n=1 Tax=Proteiniclasticum aestuarii TaxID=2817862 RepID=A0A939KH01_9CLOT|nr:hypothetical protein [Proteiniclasticum aestuarii]MBO1266067.1 hypothetical protein [Proteiniclasticum aestuarii]